MRRKLNGLGSIRTAQFKGEWSSPILFILLMTIQLCRLELTATLCGLQRAHQIRSTHMEPGVSAHHEGLGKSMGSAFAACDKGKRWRTLGLMFILTTLGLRRL